MRALLAVLAVLVCVTPARADDLEGRELARQKFRAGEAKFRAGDYRAAMVEFLAADAIAPSAILIHNLAVCHERLGESGEAVRRYREYLTRRPDAPNRAEVEARIAALDRAQRPPEVLPADSDPGDGDGLRTPSGFGEPAPPVVPPAPRAYDEPFARRVPPLGGPAEPPPAPVADAPQPQPAQPPPEHKDAPVYKQWWFWVFVGVGTLIVIDLATSGEGDGGGQAAGTTSNGLTLIKF